MICNHCGQQLPDNAAFCPACGNQFTGMVPGGRSGGNGNQNYNNGGYNNGYNNGMNGGYNNGYNNGMNGGYNNGYNNGMNGGYNNGYNNGMNGGFSKGYTNPMTLDTMLKKINTAATIWLVIGICQIISGILLLCIGYGIVTLGLGIWNLVQVKTRKENIAYFRQNPSAIVPYYESESTKIIIFLFLNLFLGAIFGVIGSIYDLTVKSYAVAHRDELG